MCFLFQYLKVVLKIAYGICYQLGFKVMQFNFIVIKINLGEKKDKLSLKLLIMVEGKERFCVIKILDEFMFSRVCLEEC